MKEQEVVEIKILLYLLKEKKEKEDEKEAKVINIKRLLNEKRKSREH